MCDGVTQGQPGMELSLFSRDVIAHGHRDRAVARHVRRRAVPGRLRQDRAGPADRRAALRPPADRLRARRPDAVGHRQRREGARPPALRRGQGRSRRAARRRGRVLPRAGHLHLLRHGQLQPDADGGDGAAPAGRGLREPEHAAARRADRAPRPGARSPSARRATSTRRSAASSTSARSSTRSSACSPPAARPTTRSTSSRSRARRASCIDWDDFVDLSDGGAADRPRLSQRQGRREPVPRRRRHGLRDRRACSMPACCTPTCSRWRARAGWRATASEPALDSDGKLVWARRPCHERRHVRSCAAVGAVQRRRRAEAAARATSAAR